MLDVLGVLGDTAGGSWHRWGHPGHLPAGLCQAGVCPAGQGPDCYCLSQIYIYIPLYMYLETFLYAAQTVWPKHLIIASPKEQNTSCSRHPPQTASAGATRSTGALSPPSGTSTHHQGGQDTVCHTCSPPQHPVGMGTLTSLRWHHWQIPQRTMVTLRLTVMMAETRRTSREGAPGGDRAEPPLGEGTGGGQHRHVSPPAPTGHHGAFCAASPCSSLPLSLSSLPS